MAMSRGWSQIGYPLSSLKSTKKSSVASEGVGKQFTREKFDVKTSPEGQHLLNA